MKTPKELRKLIPLIEAFPTWPDNRGNQVFTSDLLQHPLTEGLVEIQITYIAALMRKSPFIDHYRAKVINYEKESI